MHSRQGCMKDMEPEIRGIRVHSPRPRTAVLRFSISLLSQLPTYLYILAREANHLPKFSPCNFDKINKMFNASLRGQVYGNAKRPLKFYKSLYINFNDFAFSYCSVVSVWKKCSINIGWMGKQVYGDTEAKGSRQSLFWLISPPDGLPVSGASDRNAQG